MPKSLTSTGQRAYGKFLGDGRGKRLIVFGAGYLGGALARSASREGWSVTALTRNPETARALGTTGVHSVAADLSDEAWHGRTPKEADLAVVCVGSGGGGLEGYRRSYLGVMNSVCAWSRRVRVGTILYTGSTSVYPQEAIEGRVPVVDESAAVSSDDGFDGILMETEEALSTVVADRRFVFRLAGIYGPDRHRLLDQLRAGVSELPGRGSIHLNLIHRDDAIRAIGAAWRAPADSSGGLFNVADGKPGTRAEVVGWLAERLGIEAPRFNVETSTGGRRRFGRDRIIASDRLRTKLGWQPGFPDFRAGYSAILNQGK